MCKKALFFAYLSFILRLSFAYPSSHTRLCQLADFPSLIYPLPIPYLSLTYPLHIPYLSLTYPLPIPYLSLTYPLPIPYLSLTYRLSIAQGSVGNNYEF
ncbi:hypothetical protein J4N46_07055 [Capnocytophaga sp. Marseille-Q4570]|uniref:Uncharacterized protein n=1 Tax=Capnocytophaga bilenii TaxID=2819369 RepID=A0ABS3PXX8_9FLAO|nr:hypothetical protein [Capnocytophaga bilenii]MBO1884180.1 hypothetical protein [Capnocytophaga bilenii]